MEPMADLAEGRTLADDRRRLEQLFGEHSHALLGYLLRRTEVPEDASDALAEVMLVAWRRLDDVPPVEEARLWLFGVARRVLANLRRSAERRLRLGERLRQELAGAAFPEPEDENEAEVVRAAIRKLPEAQREVLLLNAWEGLEPAEIGVVIGVIPATARTRLHRARNQLRRELEAMEGAEEDPRGAGSPVVRRAMEERT
jgi:RNA polymerase sigma factor (sigma-70 family)